MPAGGSHTFTEELVDDLTFSDAYQQQHARCPNFTVVLNDQISGGIYIGHLKVYDASGAQINEYNTYRYSKDNTRDYYYNTAYFNQCTGRHECSTSDTFTDKYTYTRSHTIESL